MKEHVNFYENVKEAEIRINNTIVLYDDDPCFVLAVADHKDDGIIRVYLDPLRGDGEPIAYEKYSMPISTAYTHTERGQLMDQWLESSDGKASGVLRKTMNSPKFNRFRPFPLGMANVGDRAVYCERRPTRYTQQGLLDNMVKSRAVSLEEDKYGGGLSFYGAHMYNMIKGIYPSAQETLTVFREDKVQNKSVAFHRNFAFVRGPLGIVYLAYKSEIVGFSPNVSTEEVRLGREYEYLRECVQELNVFDKVS